MQFSRDLLVPDWYSKFNVLARLCAMYDHRSCWTHPECTDRVVVQCGDGRVLAPDGIEDRPHVLVLHDWDEKYGYMVDNATRVVTIGSIPGAPSCSVMVDSFPIPGTSCQPVHPSNDILVAGRCDTDSTVEYAERILDGMDRTLSVTVALYDMGSARMEKLISGLVYGETVSSFERVSWKKRQSYSMVTALYRSAGQIVHCGAGKRGLLHAMAVNAAANGAGLITRTGDNDFVPTTVEQFLSVIGDENE